MSELVSLVSFNINGTKNKDLTIDELYSKFDIVCFQEHLLTATSVNFLRRSSAHFVFTTNAKSTFGRPSGGLACIIKQKLSFLSPSCYFSDEHLLAIRLGKTVLINTYLPHDGKNMTSLNKFSKECSSLKTLLQSISKNGYEFIIIGDMNTDVKRDSARTVKLLDCLPDYRIIAKDLPFSYVHNSGSLSDIDHVICSPFITSSTVHVHEDEQDIDHLPLSLCFSIRKDSTDQACAPASKWFVRSNWKNVNMPLYISTLAILLGSLRVPFHLLQLSVSPTKSNYDLNHYYNQIVWCLKRAEEVAVPQERVRKSTRKPMWSCDPELKSVKNKAKLWLRIWVANGRPLAGNVFEIKQKTKREFKKCLRSSRYKGLEYPTNKKEWDKVINSANLNNSANPNCPITPSAWSDHYSVIFSKVNYAVHALYSKLLDSVLPPSLTQAQVIPVSVDAVIASVKKLKSSSLDIDGISACHLKINCPSLFFHLQLFFQMCLCCSLVPDSFLCGTVTSVLKRGKTPLDCSSYRPITVACNFSKILEHILLPFISMNANFGENQFGFRSGIGCQHAHRALAFLLKDASAKGYGLHICALDLSKAFDSVVHSQALYSLYSHGINLSVIFLLKFWYSNSYLRIKTNGALSSSNVLVRRGVRQGGVLSPSIFKFCISGILENISSMCFVGLSDISYLAYADDILLISRSKLSLSQMVHKVSSSFTKIGLSLNVDKCEYLSFNVPSSPRPLIFQNFSIPHVDSIRWLGITLTKNLKTLRERAVWDARVKIQIGYSKIVANRGKYNRIALGKLYSTFSDHSVLYLSGLYPIFKKKDISDIRSSYFRFCKFLLYLPLWYRNRKIIKKFHLPNITEKLTDLHKKLSETAYRRLSPHHGLIRLYD